MEEKLEPRVRETRIKVDQLQGRVDALEKALNDLTMQLSLFISQQERSLAGNNRQWPLILGRMEAIEQRVQEISRIEAMEDKMREIMARKQVIEVQFQKILEVNDVYNKVCLTKMAVPTNVMATLVVPKYAELVRNCLSWKSPVFYTHYQGYKMRLGVRGQNFDRDALLISLYTELGEYDDKLSWPAWYDFQVEIINKRGGKNMSFNSGMSCWNRPRYGTECVLFRNEGFSNRTNVKVECSNLTGYVENDSMEIRVAESPKTEADQLLRAKHSGLNMVTKTRPPVETSKGSQNRVSNVKALSSARSKKSCTVQEKTEGLLTTVWLFRYLKFVEACDNLTKTFHTHTRGYKILLGVKAHMVPEFSSEKCLLLTLYAAPGEYDEQLQWPAEFDFQLEIVNKQGGDNMTFSTGVNRWKRPAESLVSLLFYKDDLREIGVLVNCDCMGNFEANDTVEIKVYDNSKVKAEAMITETPRETKEFAAALIDKKERKAPIDFSEIEDPDQGPQYTRHNQADQAGASIPLDQPKAINIIKLNETVEGSSSNNIASFHLPQCTRFFDDRCDLRSPPFYTHYQGYKLCLGLKASTADITKNKALLLSLYSLPGEFNAELFWPAQYNFQLEIVNQHGGKNMVFRSNLVTWFAQEEGVECLKCWGGRLEQEHISVIHKKLLAFLYNDTLEVKIIVGDFGRSVGSPGVVCPESMENKCLMHNYKAIIAKSMLWRSAIFYSHFQGYRLFLTVQGYSSGELNEYLMLRVFRKCGEFDSTLPWPIKCNVHLSIINKRGGANFTFSTGMTEWRRSHQDMMPLVFMQQKEHHVYVECDKLEDFIVNDTMEFVVQCDRKQIDSF